MGVGKIIVILVAIIVIGIFLGAMIYHTKTNNNIEKPEQFINKDDNTKIIKKNNNDELLYMKSYIDSCF